MTNEEANRRVLERAKRMTPAEMLALSVRAGVHRPEGGLMPEYGGEPWHVITSYDHDADVLYLKREGAEIHDSAEGLDYLLVLNKDTRGQVIGAQLLDASLVSRAEWLDHPDRAGLPWDVRAAFDEWFEGR